MKKYGKRTAIRAVAFLIALFVSCTVSITAYAYPGTISTDNVNVRASASTGADVVTRLNSGATIEIEGEEVDASNATWYKITVNGQSGYVRADLVNTTGGGNAATGTSTATTGTSTATTTQTPTQAQPLSDRNATVNTADINVRSGAGRDYASAGTLALNATVTVTGEATDTSGSKWYRIRYNGTSEGYVLADFLDVEEPATPDPATAGTTDDPTGGASTATTPDTAAPVTEAPDATQDDGLMGKQYTVAYEPGDDGQETPYLIDNNSRAKWSVTTLIGDYDELVRLQGVEKANGRWKILSLILGILTVAAVALLAVTLIRYRRLSDGGFAAASYDDEDEEDEDDYGEEPRRRGGLFGRRASYDDEEDDEDDEYDDEEEDDEPRRKRGGLFARFRKKRAYDDEEDDYDDEDEDDYDDAPRSSSSIRRVYTPERQANDDLAAAPRSRARSMSFDDDDDDMSFRFMDND